MRDTGADRRRPRADVPKPAGEAGRQQAPLERAAAVLARERGVLAVYGFGSRAEGRAGAGSDVDVAVLLDRVPGLHEELLLRAQVVEELRRDDVDLVILNLAPPLLTYQVVAYGRRLFARDDAAADEFERRAALRCLDTAYLRATQEGIAREASR